MAAPTLANIYVPTSNWGSTADGATRSTASFSTSTGDLIVILGSAALSDKSFAAAGPSASGATITWTSQENVGTSGNFCRAQAYTGQVTSGSGTTTISWVNDGGTGTRFWGFIVYHFTAHGGVGAAESSTAAGTAPSRAITTTGADSAVVYLSADWSAIDGASRTWRTINSITPTSGNGFEKVYFRDSSQYTVYSAIWNGVGTAGSKTSGLSAPTGQDASMIAIEVLGTSSSGAISGTSSLTFAVANGALTGTGALSGTSSLTTAVANATLAGTGAMSATSSLTFTVSTPILTGAGALTGASTLTFDATGTLTGAGELTGATSTLTFTSEGNLGALAQISGASTLTFSVPDGVLAGFYAISGTSSLSFSMSTPTLLGAGSMTGTSSLTFSPTATLTGAGALTSGTSSLTFAVADADLDGILPGAISGTSSLSFSISTPVLTGAAPLSGTSSLIFTVTGGAPLPGNGIGSSFVSITYDLTLGKEYHG